MICDKIDKQKAVAQHQKVLSNRLYLIYRTLLFAIA